MPSLLIQVSVYHLGRAVDSIAHLRYHYNCCCVFKCLPSDLCQDHEPCTRHDDGVNETSSVMCARIMLFSFLLKGEKDHLDYILCLRHLGTLYKQIIVKSPSSPSEYVGV